MTGTGPIEHIQRIVEHIQRIVEHIQRIVEHVEHIQRILEHVEHIQHIAEHVEHIQHTVKPNLITTEMLEFSSNSSRNQNDSDSKTGKTTPI